MEEFNGHGLHRDRGGFLWPDLGAGACVLGGGGWAMNWLYLVGAGVSLALLVYLSVALLWPERFS